MLSKLFNLDKTSLKNYKCFNWFGWKYYHLFEMLMTSHEGGTSWIDYWTCYNSIQSTHEKMETPTELAFALPASLRYQWFQNVPICETAE